MRPEPPPLRSAANGLQSAGDRLSQEWSNLVVTVAGMSDPFGDDDIGSVIGPTADWAPG